MMLGMILAGGTVPCAAAAAGPAWEVETVYHARLPGAATITARWRFEVVAQEAGADGKWWLVQVRSHDGQFRVEADFRLQPDTGRLGSVSIREFFRDAWHAFPVLAEEPTDVFLMPFGIIPLDFIGRAGAAGKTGGESRRIVSRDSPLTSGQAVRRSLSITAAAPDAATQAAWKAADGPAAAAPWFTYRITDSLAPDDERLMTWDRELPWWLEYRTPGQTSRLVAWHPGGRSHVD